MYLDRHRLARLIELSTLERTLKGADRDQREEDVALLVKAAYDAATEVARAAFMARVRDMPASAWPWSAVQSASPRVAAETVRTVSALTDPPEKSLAPAALVLLLGQASGDASQRLPTRGSVTAKGMEPLFRALDRWDTATIAAWIGPTQWTRSNTSVPRPGPPPAEEVKETEAVKEEEAVTEEEVVEAAPPSMPGAQRYRPHIIAAGITVASSLGMLLYSRRSRLATVAE